MSLLDKYRHHTQRSPFIKNIVSIASANLVSQTLLLFAIPILTRLFTPAQFGVAALFLSVLQLVAAFCTWNFERLVPNAGSRNSALILCGFAVIALLFFSFFAILAYDFPLLDAWRGTGELGKLLLLIPLAIVALGFVKIGSGWFARETDLSPVSKSVIVYTLAYLIIAIVGGIAGLKDTALVLAIVGSYSAQFLTLFCYSNISVNRGSITSKRVWVVGKNNFPDASSLSIVMFVNTLSFAAPVFLLAQIYSVVELGGYALVLRLVITPLGVLTKSLSVSFWSRAAELARENRLQELHSLYKKVCFLMLAPALLAVGFCVVGSWVTPHLLGENWDEASKVLLVIIPYVVGFAIVSPTNHLWVLNRQLYQLFADGSRIGLMVVCICLANIFDWPFSWAVLALSVSSLVGHLILFRTHILVHKSLL